MSKSELAWKTHRLYEKGDAGVPAVIEDRNGDIVLGLCKDCGKGECELTDPCTVARDESVDGVVGDLLEGFGATEDYETAIAAFMHAGLSGATTMRVLAAICCAEKPVAYRVDYPASAGVGLPRFFGADDIERMKRYAEPLAGTVVALREVQSTRDETDHLLTSPANAERLRESITKFRAVRKGT